MTTKNKIAISIGVTSLLLLVGAGCQQLRARDRVNKGVHAFKSAKYAASSVSVICCS